MLNCRAVVVAMDPSGAPSHAARIGGASATINDVDDDGSATATTAAAGAAAANNKLPSPEQQRVEMEDVIADADADDFDDDAGPLSAERTLGGRRPLQYSFPFVGAASGAAAAGAPSPSSSPAAGAAKKQRLGPASVLPASSGKSPAERARDLVSRMTLPEKLTQLGNRQREVPRLGIPAYDFLNECLHGFWELNPSAARAPTIFPQPLSMAASFDRDTVRAVYDAVSDEMRARNNEGLKQGQGSGEATALTCWTPHINILRDPRWGRGSETWGEDPHLTAVMAAHVVRGLQGDATARKAGAAAGAGAQQAAAAATPYKKVAATCKHFLGYSLEMADGQSRYSFDARLDPRDVADTYLPAFDACVRASGARGVMCSYNAVDGTPMCANDRQLKGLLRGRWGFDGYVVSDCNAVAAFVWGHRSSPDDASAVAAALKGGTDILCDNMDVAKAAGDAIGAGALSEADVDAALERTLAVRFETGQFDQTPWDGLDAAATINSDEHKELARRAARRGMVLLKNDPPAQGAGAGAGPVLPLDKTKARKVCVVGPLADSVEHLLGNYYGLWDRKSLSPLAAIKAELASSGVQVTTDDAMRVMGVNYYDWPLESALTACSGADAAVVVVGNSMVANPAGSPGARPPSWRPVSEGEGTDRESLSLPGRQMDLVRALATRNPKTPVVLVAVTGGPVDVEWAKGSPGVAAILHAGYPGQEGGRAVADVLFGRVSPSGRLPNTWYSSNYTAAVSLTDMAMRPDASRGFPGRTYRFVRGGGGGGGGGSGGSGGSGNGNGGYVLYPFGHGLSYTTFTYSDLRVEPASSTGGTCGGRYPDAAFCATVKVTNAGPREAEDAVLMYVRHGSRAGAGGLPIKSLRGFARTPMLKPGAAATVSLPLGTLDFAAPNAKGAQSVRFGTWKVSVGDLEASVEVTRGGAVNTKRLSVRWPAESPKVAPVANSA